MKSIIQGDNKECFVCGTPVHLHLHHVMFGKNRKKADADGLTVYLCYDHHEGTNGVHGKNGSFIDGMLKEAGQRCWMKEYNKTKEDFIKRYGKNYL